MANEQKVSELFFTEWQKFIERTADWRGVPVVYEVRLERARGSAVDAAQLQICILDETVQRPDGAPKELDLGVALTLGDPLEVPTLASVSVESLATREAMALIDDHSYFDATLSPAELSVAIEKERGDILPELRQRSDYYRAIADRIEVLAESVRNSTNGETQRG